MVFTDTHSHIYSDAYAEDQEQMIQRAIKAGVERIFVPAIDSDTAEMMFQAKEKYPENIFLMMGLHPTHVKENYKEELEFVSNQLTQKKFYAVGEIGMDLYWDKTYQSQQQEAFHFQIELAKKHQLPINIHCREAFEETFEVLEAHKGESLSGIFHCFTGDKEQAFRAMDCGMKLGIGGVITFKNGKIDQFLNEVPLQHIVLETDSPYLAPTPHRGKRNESSYVINIAEKLAEIYDLPLDEIARVTTQNSKDIFGI